MSVTTTRRSSVTSTRSSSRISDLLDGYYLVKKDLRFEDGTKTSDGIDPASQGHKNYTCERCGTRFFRPEILELHLRRHARPTSVGIATLRDSPIVHSDNLDQHPSLERGAKSTSISSPSLDHRINAAMLNSHSVDEIFDRHSNLCLDRCLVNISSHLVASGGFADVWEGFVGEQKVAVKVIRRFASSGEIVSQKKLLKRLWREYLAWSCLSHPNVLQYLGFSYTFATESQSLPALVSPWMSNGTVLNHLKCSPDINRLHLVLGIAKGLHYLHTCEPGIVHGDLRAGNILVSNTGVPCLSDFGLSRVLSEVRGMTTSTEVAGSLRWMSPELLVEGNVVTPHSDVWAFGMTTLEILTGKRPYATIKSDAVCFGQIMNGSPPPRPQEEIMFLSNYVWTICQHCWSFDPVKRPSMSEVTNLLKYAVCEFEDP